MGWYMQQVDSVPYLQPELLGVCHFRRIKGGAIDILQDMYGKERISPKLHRSLNTRLHQLTDQLQGMTDGCDLGPKLVLCPGTFP